MKTEKEVMNLVFELNGRTEEMGHTGKLVFESSGYCSCVRLFGEVVWDDQDCGAPWDEEKDEQMPLRKYFMQRIAAIRDELTADCNAMLTAPVPDPADGEGEV